MAQLVVVDQILVAQRDPEHSLAHQPGYRMLDQFHRAMIGEAAGKPFDQPDLPVGGAEQHRPGLRGHLAAVKPGHHRTPFDWRKTKQIRATLCPHRASPVPETNRCGNTIFSDSAARCIYPFEKCGLATIYVHQQPRTRDRG